VSDAEASGFTMLLPFLEQDNTWQIYHFDVPWYQQANYQAVGTAVKVFYCPSNRDNGSISLAAIAAEWGTPLPPWAAACDYAFCRGANGALHQDWNRIPLEVRGVFHIRPPGDRLGLRLTEIGDGMSNTIAMGEATGGNR